MGGARMLNLAAAVGLAVVTMGSPATADQSQITTTIDSQIEAFQQDDFARAFEFASPMIQNMFRTPERFGQMVRQGYPMVWRPAEVQYGEAIGDGALVRQTVVITDLSGAVHVFEYEMLEGPEGWVINGVRRLESPRVGV